MSRKAAKREERPTPLDSGPQLRAVESPPAGAPAVVTLFLFGTLKDRRWVAAEVDVQGRSPVALRPLMATHYPEHVAKAWQQAMYTRQVERRRYSATEAQANARDGKGVELGALASWAAVGLVEAAGKVVATAMEFDGEAVCEPVVLAHGNRTFCWLEALDWAERNMLPRRRG